MTTPLHEAYATLLRRGMPEHPRLMTVCDFSTGVGDHNYFGLSGQRMDAVNPMFRLDEDDARDLITMHALRWALMALDSLTAHVHWFELFSGGSGGIYRNNFDDPDHPTPLANLQPLTILDAILEATKHLEPANAPA